jgi:hypothetical protein
MRFVSGICSFLIGEKFDCPDRIYLSPSIHKFANEFIYSGLSAE